MNSICHEKKNVFVVDDEQVICQLLEDVLELLGYNPLSCGRPLEAIEVYRKHHKDIHFVLLDMMMPEMNGQGLFKELKKINSEVKVLILSGYSMMTEIEEMLEDGAVDYIQKPVSIERLRSIISHI